MGTHILVLTCPSERIGKVHVFDSSSLQLMRWFEQPGRFSDSICHVSNGGMVVLCPRKRTHTETDVLTHHIHMWGAMSGSYYGALRVSIQDAMRGHVGALVVTSDRLVGAMNCDISATVRDSVRVWAIPPYLA